MSGKAGWTADEEREFSKALKSQMLITTPLTVILETLFSRIQSQATLFNDVQKRVDRMEARDMDGQELFKRVKTCEEQLQEISVSKLSPFKQDEIMARLDMLEQTAGMAMSAAEEAQAAAQVAALNPAEGGEDSNASPSDAPAPSTQPAPVPAVVPTPAERPTSVGRPGSVASGGGAAERIALQNALAREAKLEARIVELETRLAGVYNIGGKLMAVEDMAEELGIEIADTDYNPGGEGGEKKKAAKPPKEPSAGPLAVFGASKPLAEKSSSAASSPRKVDKPATADKDLDASRTSLRSAGGTRMLELTTRLTSVAEENEDLRSEIATLKERVSVLKSEVDGHHDSELTRMEGIERSLEGVKEGLEKEINQVRQILKSGPEVSYADFSALQSKVDSAVNDMQTATANVTEMKEVDLASLEQDLQELRKDVKKANEPREMDTLFHSRVSLLESKLSDIKNEVHAAVADIMDDVARIQDLQEIEEELEMKASTLDVKQLAQQQQQLAQSVGSMAEWLAVRPETADGAKGTGASLTKFKCLTCDREMRTQGTGNGGAQLRGNFLPKLDNYPASHGPIPGGPGLNAVEARRIVEDRLGKNQTGSPGREAPSASELDEWGAGVDVRASRAKSGTSRVPMSMPSSGIKAPAGAKTPVFI